MEGNHIACCTPCRGFRHINSFDHHMDSNMFGILTSFTVKKQKFGEAN